MSLKCICIKLQDHISELNRYLQLQLKQGLSSNQPIECPMFKYIYKLEHVMTCDYLHEIFVVIMYVNFVVNACLN